MLLKVILSHVTTLIAQSASQTALQSGFHPQDLAAGNNANKPEHSAPEIANPLIVMNLSDEELDNIRMQEILAKSVSGILILLLKWFKLSRKYCNLLGKMVITCLRRVQIRILLPTTPRLQLHTLDIEAFADSRTGKSG